MLILPPEKESKSGQNNPEKRQNLSYARGLMKSEEIFDDILQCRTKTMCVHMAEEADVKVREMNFEVVYKSL